VSVHRLLGQRFKYATPKRRALVSRLERLLV
jgi:hypothetical protein